MILLIALTLCFSCTTFDHRDYRSEAKRVIKPIISELEKIESLEDLDSCANSLKKGFNKIVDLMIATYGQEFCDDKSFDETSELLEAQLKRVYAINGCRSRMLEIQSDSLWRLDKCHKRFSKGG
jgi:hypothetical protein